MESCFECMCSETFLNTTVSHTKVSLYLHLAKMERVSQIMSVNHSDADVTVCCHHSFHCHRGDGCIGRRPTEISAPPCCL